MNANLKHRAMLRRIAYSIIKRLADHNADIGTLAEQVRQTACLIQAERKERETCPKS